MKIKRSSGETPVSFSFLLRGSEKTKLGKGRKVTDRYNGGLLDMSKAKRAKIETNLKYVREQLTRFLWQHYRVKVEMRVYANKELTKQRLYSRTVFHTDRNRPLEIDIEYTLMLGNNKKKILETAFREAVRIGLQRTGRQYTNGDKVFEAELRRHGLPSYGGVAEMGLELHAYQCTGCKKIWALKAKKMPKTKDPEQMGFMTTCCKLPFEYAGVKHYENEVLQTIKRNREGR